MSDTRGSGPRPLVPGAAADAGASSFSSSREAPSSPALRGDTEDAAGAGTRFSGGRRRKITLEAGLLSLPPGEGSPFVPGPDGGQVALLYLPPDKARTAPTGYDVPGLRGAQDFSNRAEKGRPTPQRVVDRGRLDVPCSIGALCVFRKNHVNWHFIPK